METVLILGAGGMLGRALRREFPGARPFPRAELDVTDAAAIRRGIVPGVPLVLNAAGFTRVDQAETDPAHLAVNSEGPGLLAARCRDVGARLVHVSTDYVFDGRGTRPLREGDPLDPVNAYGAGKRAGEERVLSSGAEALVVRTSWVFGVGGANFIDSLLSRAESGERSLKIVADQTGRPTAARDLARAIRLLAERRTAGVVHFANAGATTWFELGAEALRLAGHGDVRVQPCATGEFPRPARRPAFSVLDTGLYERIVGESPRPWREAVADYVRERAASASPVSA